MNIPYRTPEDSIVLPIMDFRAPGQRAPWTFKEPESEIPQWFREFFNEYWIAVRRGDNQ